MLQSRFVPARYPTLALVLVAALLLAALPPRLARAQAGGERTTEHFVIVHPPRAAAVADYYAGRADAIYRALAATFELELPAPLTLRLHADDEAFLVANPLFVEIDGVLAQARRGRRELALSLPRVLDGRPMTGPFDPAVPDAALDNALRLELAYLFLGRLGEDRLAPGFLAGAAAYMQQPTGDRAAGVARLREARAAGALIDWSRLNAPGAEYLDPPLAGPQALSIVHFLVERRGFADLLGFLRASAEASGWREALERSYGAPPSALYAAWEAWLPSYLDGGWRRHALYGADLAPAEALMRRGDFAGAAAQLAGTVSLLEGVDPAAAERARQRQAEAEAGLAAREQSATAAAALMAGRYAEARQLAEPALATLERLGDAGGADYARALAERAGEGDAARRELARAEALPPWRAAEARLAAYRAMRGFGRVGNEAQAARAAALVERLDRRQAPLGWALLTAGLATVGWSLRQRRRERWAP